MEQIIAGEISSPDNSGIIALSIDPSKMEGRVESKPGFSRSSEIFARRLSESLSSNLTASDAMRTIIKSALEVEYGTNFTLNKGFDKMIKKLTDSMMTTPEIRRQALSLVSIVLEQRSLAEKKVSNG